MNTEARNFIRILMEMVMELEPRKRKAVLWGIAVILVLGFSTVYYWSYQFKKVSFEVDHVIVKMEEVKLSKKEADKALDSVLKSIHEHEINAARQYERTKLLDFIIKQREEEIAYLKEEVKQLKEKTERRCMSCDPTSDKAKND